MLKSVEIDLLNPNQAKKNTRPYLSTGLRIGIERALPLTGLISGAAQREERPMIEVLDVRL
jgi:hypothetical protein